ncbi:hypothetical protein [Umezawaea sp.]|uniref:hypothetical protein n=1 Tax=Umezawaea sp. TaxID=1955258 RepID=UPI002ED1DE74
MSAKSSAESARDLRTRTWLGVVMVVGAAFLIGDPASRLSAAWRFLDRWWPFLLLGLAVLNVVRALVPSEFLLAPGLIALVGGIALAVRQDALTTLEVVVPIVVALAGTTLLLLIGPGPSWTRVFTSGRVDLDRAPAGVLRPRAIVGQVRANLITFDAPQKSDLVVEATAVLGHVRLVVPANQPVVLVDPGGVWSKIVDPGPYDRIDPKGPAIRLHVLAVAGIVSVKRL